jgi:hypothetical protein
MKRFFLIFTAVLLVCFYSISFTAVNSKATGASNALRYKISPVSTVHQYKLFSLDENEEDTTFEMDSDRLASGVTILKKKSSRIKKLSKCNRSNSLLIDKKSVLKATPFKSDIEFCRIHFKDGAFNQMAAKDISNLSTTAMESIHQTSLTTLQSFLF